MEGYSVTNDILRLNGLSEDILKSLSYKSQLGKSLKKNLHYFKKNEVLRELAIMCDWLFEHDILANTALDYRIKSLQSIETKYDRYYPDRQMRQVFNDILGFRAYCDNYNKILLMESDIYRIVDMSSGKSNDDGYRGVHLYYQLDNYHYPIEIQFNTLFDRQLNNWLHDYLYKKDYPNEVGQKIRHEYEIGSIKNEDEFKEVLQHVLHSTEKR